MYRTRKGVCERSECIQPYLYTFLQLIFHSEYKTDIFQVNGCDGLQFSMSGHC